MRFTFRAVEEELEARLAPANGAGASGKAERKRYAGGEERLKVKASGLSAPDGALARISIGGRHAAQAPVAGGRVRIDLETPAAVPAARSGEPIELLVDGEVLLRGTFAPE